MKKVSALFLLLLVAAIGVFARLHNFGERIFSEKSTRIKLNNDIRKPNNNSQPGKYMLYSGKGLSFIENVGQIKDQYHNQRKDIQYKMAVANGLNIFIGKGAIHYQWAGSMPSNAIVTEKIGRVFPATSGSPLVVPCIEEMVSTYRMDVELVGANTNAKVIADEKQHYFETYYTTGAGELGAVAHAYNRITYKEIYPNIDWVLYTSASQAGKNALKHEFVVRKGGKVSDIKLKYGGATALKLDKAGALTAATPQGTITEQAPYTYQRDGKKIASSFKLTGNVLGYDVGKYDGELVIDPTLGWATYYGNAGNDRALSVKTDTYGNVYMSGRTSITSGLATTGAHQMIFGGDQDVILVKFRRKAMGYLLW